MVRRKTRADVPSDALLRPHDWRKEVSGHEDAATSAASRRRYLVVRGFSLRADLPAFVQFGAPLERHREWSAGRHAGILISPRLRVDRDDVEGSSNGNQRLAARH